MSHHHHHHHHHHRRHHHHHSYGTRKKQYDAKSIRRQKIVGICMAVIGVGCIVVGIVSAVGALPSTFLSTFITLGILFLIMGFGYMASARFESKKLTPDTVVCPDCGANNKIESTFCEICGKTLRATCPYCGADLNEDSNVCPQCGQTVEI